jgi:hypothetical protein
MQSLSFFITAYIIAKLLSTKGDKHQYGGDVVVRAFLDSIYKGHDIS